MSILSLAAWEPVEEVVSGDRGSLAGGSDQEKLCGADGACVGNLLERRMPVSLRQRPDQAMRAYHRSEEHTSELQSLMRISYAVFCLNKKKNLPRSLTTTSAHLTITDLH